MIRILVTGGTFDKEYNELTGTLFFRHTHVPEMLRLGRCRVDVVVQTLMMIDSLDMTDGDRARIVDECRRGRGDADRHHARHRHDGRNRDGAGRGVSDRTAARRSC